MLIKVKELKRMGVCAKDGEIGRIRDVYFDDHHWGVRYVVVDTGGWLSGRSVLVSPRSVRGLDVKQGLLQLDLMKEQVRHSPDIDTDKPVSRQHEISLDTYYGYPAYWGGPFMWGGSPYPTAITVNEGADVPLGARDSAPPTRSDPNLRSAREVTGYHIQATDKELGHVEDFLIEADSWAVRYLLIDTRKWWPGRPVLVSPEWVHQVDWEARKVRLALTHEAIENSPEYDDSQSPTREYEGRLFEHYQRKGYWLFHP